MEYAKDEIFNITYNSTKDKLEMKKKNRTTTIWKKIKKHKFISFVILLFFIFSTFTIILINYFITILQETYY